MGVENPLEELAYAPHKLDLEEIKGRLHMDRRGEWGVVVQGINLQDKPCTLF